MTEEVQKQPEDLGDKKEEKDNPTETTGEKEETKKEEENAEKVETKKEEENAEKEEAKKEEENPEKEETKKEEEHDQQSEIKSEESKPCEVKPEEQQQQQQQQQPEEEKKQENETTEAKTEEHVEKKDEVKSSVENEKKDEQNAATEVKTEQPQEDGKKKDEMKKRIPTVPESEQSLKNNHWVCVKDEATGLPFYYNPATGDTQWSKPKNMGKSDASKEKEERKSGPGADHPLSVTIHGYWCFDGEETTSQTTAAKPQESSKTETEEEKNAQDTAVWKFLGVDLNEWMNSNAPLLHTAPLRSDVTRPPSFGLPSKNKTSLEASTYEGLAGKYLMVSVAVLSDIAASGIVNPPGSPPEGHKVSRNSSSFFSRSMTLRASLWKDGQRLTEDMWLKPSAKNSGENVWGVFGPFKQPIEGRVILMLAVFHRYYQSLCPILLDISGNYGHVYGANNDNCLLGPTSLLPYEDVMAMNRSSGSVTPPLSPTSNSVGDGSNTGPSPLMNRRMHTITLERKGRRVGITNAVVSVNGKNMSIRTQVALIGRLPLQYYAKSNPISRALSLESCPSDLFRGRNNVYVSLNLDAFSKNALSVEGFNLPDEYEVRMYVICKSNLVAPMQELARHKKRLSDNLPSLSVTSVELNAETLSDPSLYIMFDFVIRDDSIDASIKRNSFSSGAGSKHHKHPRVSFAWAYFRFYTQQGDPVKVNTVASVQVYCGSPLRITDPSEQNTYPVVSSLTSPEALKRETKEQSRALASESSLLGLAVTTVPVTINVVSAAKEINNFVGKRAVQNTMQLITDSIEGSSNMNDAVIAAHDKMPPAALVHMGQQLSEKMLKADDPLKMAIKMKPLFLQFVNGLGILESVEGFAYLNEVIEPVPEDLLKGLIQNGIKEMQEIAVDGNEESNVREWVSSCVATSLIAKHLMAKKKSSDDSGICDLFKLLLTTINDCCAKVPDSLIISTILWSCATLVPEIFGFVSVPDSTAALCNIFTISCSEGVRRNDAMRAQLARLTSALFSKNFGDNAFSHVEDEARKQILPVVCTVVFPKLFSAGVSDAEILAPAGNALMMNSEAFAGDNNYLVSLGLAAAVIIDCMVQYDFGCALALLNYFSMAAQCGVMRSIAVHAFGSVGRTGRLLEKLARMWRMLFSHLVLVSNANTISKVSDGSSGETLCSVGKAIITSMEGLVNACIKSQDAVWMSEKDAQPPHGAMLALLADVCDPLTDISLSDKERRTVLSLIARLVGFFSHTGQPIEPALCGMVSPSLWRTLSVYEQASTSPIYRVCLECLTALLIGEWRATKDADGLFAGTTAWLASTIFSKQSSIVSAIPRIVRTFYSRVSDAVSSRKLVKLPSSADKEAVAAAIKMTTEILRLAARIVSHVRLAYMAFNSTDDARLVSFDLWQSLLSVFLRVGLDASSRRALAAATLTAAQRCSHFTASSGEYEVDAHMRILQYDLMWELSASESLAVLEAFSAPSVSMLKGALQSFMQMCDYESAMHLVKRLAAEGVISPNHRDEMQKWLCSRGTFVLPSTYYMLRFDGYQLPPDVDGNTFMVCLMPGVQLLRLISRLRKRFGNELTIIVDAGKCSPVFRPAKCVHIVQAWPQAEVDRWADRIRSVKPERCPASVVQRPTTQAFSLFLPIFRSVDSQLTENPVPPQQEEDIRIPRERERTPLMRAESESVFGKNRARSVDDGIRDASYVMNLTSSARAPSVRAVQPDRAFRDSHRLAQVFVADEFTLDGKSVRITQDMLEDVSGLLPHQAPFMRANVAVERPVPGPLWLSPVTQIAYSEVSAVDACTGWVSLQCTKLLHLCSRLRCIGKTSATAAGTRCPSCAKRLLAGQATSVELLLPNSHLFEESEEEGAKLDETKKSSSKIKKSSAEEAVAAELMEAMKSVPRTKNLDNPEFALEVLRSALAEIVSDGQDSLLGLKKCAEIVTYESVRLKVLRNALEAQLRRNYIRDQKEGKFDGSSSLRRPDWSTLRIKSQERFERLRAWLAQLRLIVGYAFIQVDALSKHSMTDLLQEHLHWEETVESLFVSIGINVNSR